MENLTYILLFLAVAALGLLTAVLSGQQQLKRTLTSFLSQKPAKQENAGVSETVLREMQQLQNQIAEQNKTIEDKTTELTRLKESEEAVADANVKMAELYMELEDSNTLLEDTNRELQELNEQLKETQDQLVVAEKMAALGQLVAGVAHEINTPVGVSVTAASHIEKTSNELSEMLASGQIKRSLMTKSIENLAESSKLILSNLHRAAELIQSFKKVAVEQGQSDIVSFNLHSHLSEVLLSLSPEFRKTSIRYEINGDSALILKSIPGSISQIVINFVMNSLRHAYPDLMVDGMLSIEFQQLPNNRISLTYRDNGQGIAEDILPRIFDPFFTTKRGDGGSGLGLHIVYNIITQQLKGSVKCSSVLGQGTRFDLELPVSLEQEVRTPQTLNA